MARQERRFNRTAFGTTITRLFKRFRPAPAATLPAVCRDREAHVRESEFQRQKKDLVAAVSHDFRTPLTTLQGYLEMFGEGDLGDLTEVQHTAVMKMQRSVSRLSSLVADMLTAGEIEAGELKVHARSVDVREILQSAFVVNQPSAIARGVALHLDLGQELDTMVVDAAHLDRCVRQLLSNAIKFTHPGGSVYLHCSQDADEVRISVTDTGIGIEPDDLPRVFDRFFRAGAADAHATDGSGLGLSNARATARALCGDIIVSSVSGEGSTFTLTLPVGATAVSV